MHKTAILFSKPPTEVIAPRICLVTNLLLCILKLVSGFLCAAPALLSDAIHSAADLVGTFIVMIGLGLSAKEPDKEHPYGHERFECIASILLSIFLCATGIGVGYNGIRDILTGAYLAAEPPMTAAICVALLSVIVKLLLYRYMTVTAKKTHSTALHADALHQISDALASFGALIGIAASLLGFPIFDPLASVLIALFLFRSAFGIFSEAAVRLIDRSAEEQSEEALRIAIAGTCGVVGIQSLRTRLFGSQICVEAEILLDASLTLAECDPIVRCVRRRVLESGVRVGGCSIAVCPTPPTPPSRLGEDS